MGSVFVIIFIAVKLKFGLISFAEYVNENQHLVQNYSTPICRIVPANIVSNSKIIIKENENQDYNYVVRFRSGNSETSKDEYVKNKQIVVAALRESNQSAQKQINESLRSFRFLSDGSLINSIKEALNNPDFQKLIKEALASSLREVRVNQIKTKN